ncbi:hypothetical protein BDV96DRAFT_481665 [Lophiotrema nucula]|uniref:FAR-17a/AIG1-like protein n=1 Tax=Lophiotrema nucula TaxID=690887 RepID=A0A6A5ZVB0_9PLEO|nr:hypothetical protein BDV96DRAFT_481665 [Lophiotrema nucula]
MQLFSYEAYGLPPTGFDPNKTFVRSSLISTLILALVRAILALYCFTTIIVCYAWLAHNHSRTNLQDVNISSYTLITGSSGIGQSFSFFTYLTFWSLGFYFLFASIHTFFYWRRGTAWLYTWPRPLQLLHSFYYTTMTCFPFLVSVVFWGTMYSGPWSALGRFEQWINLSVHGLNSLFAITEIILPATKRAPWSHLSVLLVVLSLYLGLAYLTRWTGGFYVYEWMNPAHGWVSIVVHIVCYTGGIVTIFFLVQGAIWARAYLTGDARRDDVDGKMIKLADGSQFSLASTLKTEVSVEVSRV